MVSSIEAWRSSGAWMHATDCRQKEEEDKQNDIIAVQPRQRFTRRPQVIDITSIQSNDTSSLTTPLLRFLYTNDAIRGV